MAQCYAGEAEGATMEDALRRMTAYKEVGEVDWVQFSAPRSAEEIERARQSIDSPFSVMQGHMTNPLANGEPLELG